MKPFAVRKSRWRLERLARHLINQHLYLRGRSQCGRVRHERNYLYLAGIASRAMALSESTECRRAASRRSNRRGIPV